MKLTIYIWNLLIFFFSAYALQANVVVLVSGKIIDTETGKPVTTKVKFIDDNGKAISTPTNSNDGAFQQVLTSGNSYQVVVEGWLTNNEQKILKIPAFTEYAELGYDFKVKKLQEGLVVSANNFFEKNSEKIKPDAVEEIKSIKELMKNQVGLVFEVTINSSDSYFKKKVVKESYIQKGRKKTRNGTVTTETQLNELLDKRKNAFIELLKELQIQPKNFNIKTELVVIPPKPKAKINTKSKSKQVHVEELFADNLIIKIEKVMKF